MILVATVHMTGHGWKVTPPAVTGKGQRLFPTREIAIAWCVEHKWGVNLRK
jgi:hypothetical protein